MRTILDVPRLFGPDVDGVIAPGAAQAVASSIHVLLGDGCSPNVPKAHGCGFASVKRAYSSCGGDVKQGGEHVVVPNETDAEGLAKCRRLMEAVRGKSLSGL
jgi:hypothetical protein